MNSGNGFHQGMSFAVRLGVELVVATGVGTLMGLALDNFFGTRPWFLVAGVLFGGAAGCLGVYRIASTQIPIEEDESEEKLPGPDKDNKDDLNQ